MKSFAIAAALILLAVMPAPAASIVTFTVGAGGTPTTTTQLGLPSPFPGTSMTFNGELAPSGIVVSGGTFLVNGSSSQETISQDGTSAQLFASTTSITNISGSTATLFLLVGGTQFTAPLGGILQSHVGGTNPSFNPANAITYQSYANPLNTDTVGGTTPGLQTPVLTSSPGSYSSDASIAVSGLPGTGYSLVQALDITLAAGTTLNLSDSTLITPATPEPASIVMCCTSAIMVGGFTYLQKRRRRRLA